MGWWNGQQNKGETEREMCVCCSISWLKPEPPCSISHSVGPDAPALKDTHTHTVTHVGTHRLCPFSISNSQTHTRCRYFSVMHADKQRCTNTVTVTTFLQLLPLSLSASWIPAFNLLHWVQEILSAP